MQRCVLREVRAKNWETASWAGRVGRRFIRHGWTFQGILFVVDVMTLLQLKLCVDVVEYSMKVNFECREDHHTTPHLP